MLRRVLLWPLRQAALRILPREERATAFQPPPPLPPGLPEALLAPLAAIDIPNLISQTKDTLLAQERDERVLTFRIRREAR